MKRRLCQKTRLFGFLVLTFKFLVEECLARMMRVEIKLSLRHGQKKMFIRSVKMLN